MQVLGMRCGFAYSYTELGGTLNKFRSLISHDLEPLRLANAPLLFDKALR